MREPMWADGELDKEHDRRGPAFLRPARPNAGPSILRWLCETAIKDLLLLEKAKSGIQRGGAKKLRKDRYFQGIARAASSRWLRAGK